VGDEFFVEAAPTHVGRVANFEAHLALGRDCCPVEHKPKILECGDTGRVVEATVIPTRRGTTSRVVGATTIVRGVVAAAPGSVAPMSGSVCRCRREAAPTPCRDEAHN
jgi:hypothetical protein